MSQSAKRAAPPPFLQNCHTSNVGDAENSDRAGLDHAALVGEKRHSTRNRTRVGGGTIWQVAGVIVGTSLLLLSGRVLR